MSSPRKRVRLHKFIANCGYTSRRRAELLIGAGRVRVNGRVATNVGTTIDPDKDTVEVNGETVELPAPVTIMLNKPAGILTSTHDTHDRLTVMDLLPKSLRETGVLPAGRLDQDTEGLLVLTNDGDLGHRITHPRYETEKEYEAVVAGRPSTAKLDRLERGVVIEGRTTAPATVVSVAAADQAGEPQTTVHLIIREGRKRQVRLMFRAVGHDVLKLRRVRVGGLKLGKLPCGEWRELRPAELEALLGSQA